MFWTTANTEADKMSDRYCGEGCGSQGGSNWPCGDSWVAGSERRKCEKCKAYDQGFRDGVESSRTIYRVALVSDIDHNAPTYEMPK